MKKLFLFALVAGLVLLPLLTYGAEYGTAKSKPHASQSLVREGDYAIKLVSTLKLGKVRDEAKAEDVLAAKGIAPKNGWISNFPVTPAVVAELRASVKAAASSGKIRLDKKVADRSITALNKRLGLGGKA